MFRLFIFVLIIFSPFASFGQSLDSLLIQSYDAYRDYEYEKAIKLAEEAIQLAEKENNAGALIQAQYYNAISIQERDPSQSDPKLIEEMIQTMDELGLDLIQARAHNFLANMYKQFGDIEKSLENRFAAMDIYQEMGSLSGISATHSSLSLLYYDQHDYEPAFYHARKSVEIDKGLNEPSEIQGSYNNLAIIFEHTGPIDSAIFYHKLSLAAARESNNPYSIGLALSNLGNNYANDNKLDLAEETLLEALRIRDSLGYSRGLAYTHNRLANLYQRTNELAKARFHAEKSLENAEKAGEVKVLRMAYERLMEVAEKTGDYRAELDYLKKATALKDSIINESNTRELTQTVMNYEFEKKQMLDSIQNEQARIEQELVFNERLTKERNKQIIFVISGLLFLVVAIGFYRRSQYIKKSSEIIAKEKERSDELLLNILPASVAEELKANGHAEAKQFEQVSVIFTDFAGFTKKAAALTANELVKELNICFKAFDSIIEEYKLEKIKTIGDAYMAAGGLNSESTVSNVVLAALKMKAFINERNANPQTKTEVKFDMRCGINTGPVVAGIVGIKKFQYDIWGDTVNVAQRMETACEINRINISETTYGEVKDNPRFKFEYRGEVEVKGKGLLPMWYVEEA
ncbi:adenylate/guanylate cyclase domain-containing protein [Algoriphagus sediminis]|uniref:Adenylate/guanylate cyclase domain-containing protein n=1 Tax=Algoriphagus sediminis TaxID=3057113 RepID=A0ABT7YC87_9BACT|nr:adenylate/guanylate cyclase domain-containing protein [Algoriphagus sediminis]MDN3204129.1 adenylate/guanylate cyclase domain-containing protein [Algoriphagus sediminis]